MNKRKKRIFCLGERVSREGLRWTSQFPLTPLGLAMSVLGGGEKQGETEPELEALHRALG